MLENVYVKILCSRKQTVKQLLGWQLAGKSSVYHDYFSITPIVVTTT